MNSTNDISSKPGIEGRPAHMGEKVAGFLIVAMVIYLFIAQ